MHLLADNYLQQQLQASACGLTVWLSHSPLHLFSPFAFIFSRSWLLSSPLFFYLSPALPSSPVFSFLVSPLSLPPPLRFLSLFLASRISFLPFSISSFSLVSLTSFSSFFYLHFSSISIRLSLPLSSPSFPSFPTVSAFPFPLLSYPSSSSLVYPSLLSLTPPRYRHLSLSLLLSRFPILLSLSKLCFNFPICTYGHLSLCSFT